MIFTQSHTQNYVFLVEILQNLQFKEHKDGKHHHVYLVDLYSKSYSTVLVVEIL